LLVLDGSGGSVPGCLRGRGLLGGEPGEETVGEHFGLLVRVWVVRRVGEEDRSEWDGRGIVSVLDGNQEKDLMRKWGTFIVFNFSVLLHYCINKRGRESLSVTWTVHFGYVGGRRNEAWRWNRGFYLLLDVLVPLH
jgi:hypothetical protein